MTISPSTLRQRDTVAANAKSKNGVVGPPVREPPSKVHAHGAATEDALRNAGTSNSGRGHGALQ
eukprot:8455503-Lingulodinium_polyedra.AAC.1